MELPRYLALGPLIAALAAGNRVMIKLPEITPNTNAMLRRMLAEVFNEDEVAVLVKKLQILLDLPLCHLTILYLLALLPLAKS